VNYSNRIFLIGMPGAGKTRAGKVLARELEYTFVDLDHVIEEMANMAITEIFQEKGEETFREIERDALRSQLDSELVLSTGGGASCFHDNMKWMNDHGLTVFINPRIELIIDRVKKADHRPLLQSNPEGKLMELLDRRVEFYTQAQMETKAESADEISRDVKRYLSRA